MQDMFSQLRLKTMETQKQNETTQMINEPVPLV